ncbi:MAG: D-aminoacyl-tRNA deacylase [Candidatus Falkowbacteria bacterium]
MRAVIQVVRSASVSCDDKIVGEVAQGYLILLAICHNDTEDKILKMADKIANLRIFMDQEEKMNLSLKDVGGEILLVSQFTLYGDTKKGNRPSFIDSARPDKAEPYYEKIISLLRDKGFKVATGIFGAKMSISLVNEGPTTIIIDL